MRTCAKSCIYYQTILHDYIISERVFSIPACVGLWHDFKNSKIITGREVGCLTLGLIHVQLLEKLVIVTSNYLVYKYLFVPLLSEVTCVLTICGQQTLKINI